ncbi:RES domain-containing protein [Pseudomonas stutzeri]|uniref:RES family NAD+ phosphorylase n=1 Tax=Stutzerimonas stutzeri TaxID=316 RepID=UPI00210CA8B3|nr:RES domain-containing protein [Stutzerimonas stutzeri]MCQ4313912.1 RES domain-containing protein [Stutzerimonas stutzeri]
MPKCCALCFEDKQISREIDTHHSDRGTCSFCGAEDVLVIEPVRLREFFEQLQGSYAVAEEGGKNLAEWFKLDWRLFDSLSVLQTKELLGEIFDDANLLRLNFNPISQTTSTNLDLWARLRTELMEENRFFPKDTISHERMHFLATQLILQNADIPAVWFRARIQESSTPYAMDKMGPPPKDKATHGRANPAGISYLYMASDLTTAISEIRPHTGELVTVAEFELIEELKLVDLQNPRKLVTPFICENESDIVQLRGDVEFLERFGEELTRPVLPRAAAIDYIPSQYLCEMIKKFGFDGVIYRSSVGNEMNIALFYPQKARARGTSMHYVSKVDVQAIPQPAAPTS